VAGERDSKTVVEGAGVIAFETAARKNLIHLPASRQGSAAARQFRLAVNLFHLPDERPSVNQRESLECQSKGVTLVAKNDFAQETSVDKKRE